jgi:hypothetical protein
MRLRTINPNAVVHSADRCSRLTPPMSPENSASPAQNDGSIGVMGDCSVAKNALMSGSESTFSRRSGWTNRSSMIRAPAKTRPINISTSRARRAGNTFTSVSVTSAPIATGMITNGATASSAAA